MPKSCLDCPFFQTNLMSMFAAPSGGICSYSKEEDASIHIRSGLPPGVERDAMMAKAERRLRVEDAKEDS
jgi:hypothetical protein